MHLLNFYLAIIVTVSINSLLIIHQLPSTHASQFAETIISSDKNSSIISANATLERKSIEQKYKNSHVIPIVDRALPLLTEDHQDDPYSQEDNWISVGRNNVKNTSKLRQYDSELGNNKNDDDNNNEASHYMYSPIDMKILDESLPGELHHRRESVGILASLVKRCASQKQIDKKEEKKSVSGSVVIGSNLQPSRFNGAEIEDEEIPTRSRAQVERGNYDEIIPKWISERKRRNEKRNEANYDNEESIDETIGLGDSELESEDETDNGQAEAVQLAKNEENENDNLNEPKTKSASDSGRRKRSADLSSLKHNDRDDEINEKIERLIDSKPKRERLTVSSTVDDAILPVVRRQEEQMLSMDDEDPKEKIQPKHDWTILTTRKYLDKGLQNSDNDDDLFVKILVNGQIALLPMQENSIDANQWNSDQDQIGRPNYHGIYLPRFSRRSLFSK